MTAHVVRRYRAGCWTCHGPDAPWTGANAHGLAARHNKRTGHATWCDIAIQYGCNLPDLGQIDIEDAIASASSGGRPDAAPLPDPDAPAVAPADVSAPEGRPVETRRHLPRGVRGRKPETANA